jgi:NAD(P)-dependent dehydrogenase (short-subunit alcohol dehydrogenase family)
VNPISLSGKVSIVTGAGRGIGRAIALALAEAGSDVVLSARTVDQLEETAAIIRSIGGRALPIQTDVTSEESVHRAVAQTMAHFHQVDILVNNAGSNNGGPQGAIGPLWEINTKAWWNDVTVNLLGTFLFSNAVLKHMVARGSGRIINIAAMISARPGPFQSAYTSSKAAIVRLTDSLAAEVQSYGIAVFALAPGLVRSDMTAGVLDSDAGRLWLGAVSAELDGLPWIGAEVPAAAVLFLASGQADSLSGRFLQVSDDLEDLAQRGEEIVATNSYQLRYRAD